MVAVVIVALLAGTVAIGVAAYVDQGRMARATTDLASIETAVKTFYGNNGRYPTSSEGLAHLMRNLAPLYLMCDPRDLGVSADLDFPFTRCPTVIIHDAVPGGVGFSKALYELHDELLGACWEWVQECPCEEGCPACIGAPPQIGAGAKARVERLLRYMRNED